MSLPRWSSPWYGDRRKIDRMHAARSTHNRRMTNEPTLPPPTWRLEADTIVAFSRVPAAERARLPEGAHGLPGLGLVFAISYSNSPVGPYLETVVCIPARYLGRAGYCVTTIVVDSEPALWAGLDFWGYPKVLGTMEWQADGRDRELRWKERDLVVRAGYGVYFNPEIATEYYDLVRNGIINETNFTLGTEKPILTLQNGFPQTASTGFPSSPSMSPSK